MSVSIKLPGLIPPVADAIALTVREQPAIWQSRPPLPDVAFCGGVFTIFTSIPIAL